MGIYWKSVAERAWREARSDMGIGGVRAMVIAMILSVSASGILYMWGGYDAATGDLIPKFAAISAMLCIAPIIFLIRLLTVPATMDAEKSARIGTMAASSSNHNETEAIIATFMSIHKRASDLLYDFMGGDEPDEVSILLTDIEREAHKLDARSKHIILADNKSNYNYRRWQQIILDDEDFPEIALLALRVQAIERVFPI